MGLLMYLKSIVINHDSFPNQEVFPFNIPVFQATERVDFISPVTFFVGENGTGKSALIDAIARKAGFLPWGGTKIHRAHHNPYETQLANHVDLEFESRHPYGFHFRAEAFFNFASSLDDILLDDPHRDKYYGGGSLNVLSHGESFLAFFRGYSFRLQGLYLLDEPEAALSPQSQLEFVRVILEGAQNGGKQYIIATHSPVILSCPGARILNFNGTSIEPVAYRQTASYAFYKEFLNNPDKFFPQ
jgi:predicted ATPase